MDTDRIVKEIGKLPTSQEKIDEYLTSVGYAGSNIANVIDAITVYNGGMSLDTAITAALHTIDTRGRPLPIQRNREQQGLVLWTRPRFNLASENIAKDRTLNLMNNTNPLSMQRYIRAILDPVGSDPLAKNTFHTQLVDPLQCFIPVFTNTCESLSGFPDPTVDIFTSKAGIYREQYTLIDGIAKNYEAMTMTANFQNMVRNPLPYMLYVMLLFPTLTRLGVCDPHIDAMINNEKDYDSRVYRILLDESGKYVEDIMNNGAGFITNVSLGARANYDRNKVYNQEQDSLSVSFSSNGMMYFDPMSVWAFNRAVTQFNIGMNDGIREEKYRKLSLAERVRLNGRPSYFRIDPTTMEFEVWMDKRIYKIATGAST